MKVSKQEKIKVLVRLGIRDKKEIKKILKMRAEELNEYMYSNYYDQIMEFLRKEFEPLLAIKTK